MSKRQFILGMLASSLLGGLVVLLGIGFLGGEDGVNGSFSLNRSNSVATSFGPISDEPHDYSVPEGVNFIEASRKIVPAVVHITNREEIKGTSSRLRRMLRNGMKFRESTGSGVLISEDGYIATNFHVVDGADELEVRLDDNRRLKAEVIGADPDTDLALIKIKAQAMPYIDFGNSDLVEIGEWVLAVGNPFDLNNTVTAGIVSAKARNINLIAGSVDNRYGIESFLQTDAVVNRGNSGGALVNLQGELIGINTAIATNTGTFSGYSFAVPSILVKKVMDDLLEFGEVRRGLLGVTIRDADGVGTVELSGVRIMGVSPGGAADKAGLKEEDVITGVDGKLVKTTSQLQELIARKRPGDAVSISFKRKGNDKETSLKLQNKETLAAIDITEPELVFEDERDFPENTLAYEIAGAEFKDLTKELKRTLKIESGVQVSKLNEGAWKASGVKEGFVVTKVGDDDITSLEQFQKIIDTKTKDFFVMGKYPNGTKEYYRITW
ncbi:trypsin-like peptidase domain-containing protein [uncultured Roseivirga sp.]|uniref:trypsin-like peptidase domain-containing protein n=1 Tax=uncultured Roseivirga sp. TaxID=543088 RepID=UPI0030DDC94F